MIHHVAVNDTTLKEDVEVQIPHARCAVTDYIKLFEIKLSDTFCDELIIKKKFYK